MHESVQMPGRFLYLFAHVVVDLHIEDIGYKIQCILIILNFRIKAGQIEAVGQVIFINLAKIFVAA